MSWEVTRGEHSTRKVVRWPICMSGRATLIDEVCVAPTTREMESDPANLLPRLSVRIAPELPSKVTAFLVNDENDTFARATGSFQGAALQCEELVQRAKATIFPAAGQARVSGARSLRGVRAHKWFILAVDCSGKAPTCANVSEAEVQFFHPNSDGSQSACGGAGGASIAAIKQMVASAWEGATSGSSSKNVSGLAATVLFCTCGAMLICSFLFTAGAWREHDELRKACLTRAAAANATAALVYLALAAGSGVATLKLVVNEGGASSEWVYADEGLGLGVQGGPFAGVGNRGHRTYPFMWSRYAAQLVWQGVALDTLAAIAGAPPNAGRALLLMSSASVVSLAAAAALTTPARLPFLLIGCISLAGVALIISEQVLGGPEGNAIPSKGGLGPKAPRAARRLVTRLALLLLAVLPMYPVLLLCSEISHALPPDVSVLAYAALDISGLCLFSLTLLRGLPSLGTQA